MPASTRKRGSRSAAIRTANPEVRTIASTRRRSRATNRRRRRSGLRGIPSPAQLATHLRTLGARALPGLLLAAGVCFLIGASYLGFRWFTESPRFDIVELQLRGNEQLSHDQLQEILALEPHANIFRTDMDTLEARLLANPWVSQASVSRSLPRALEIEITEEVAAAAVELDGLYLINPQGEAFKRADVSGGEVEGLCIITGLSREDFLAKSVESKDKLLYALAALKSYQAKSTRPRLGELHFDHRHGISLITYENAIAIHLGSPDGADFDDRYRSFDSAWGALDSEEHAAARAFRIADRTPSDQVTIAFAGN